LEIDQSYENLTDEQLVEEIVLKNNPLLFEFLYDRYAKIVFNKCLAFSKSVDEAKDLTQDIFLNLFLKLPTFEGRSKFSTWLYALTYNFCANYVSRDKQRKINSKTEEVDESTYEYLIEVSEDSLFQVKVEKLKRVLDLISTADRSILLLKYQDDVSINELGKLLNIGESAVKMRLKRARARVVELCSKIQ